MGDVVVAGRRAVFFDGESASEVMRQGEKDDYLQRKFV